MSLMVDYLERLDVPEGFSESPLKGVRFFKSLQPIPRTPLIYDPGIIIIVQGSKVGYLNGKVFHYDANNYLVLSVSIPFECETFASPDCPLLGIYIDVELSQLHDLISQMGSGIEFKKEKSTLLPQGIGPATLDEDMADATVRLLKCFQSETEARVLGPGLVREILYRALCGTQAPVLWALVMHNGNFTRVTRALKTIHSDYPTKLTIKQLAQQVDMSVSAFHRVFKEVTSDSPMQYLKKIRLNKAREFLLQEEIKTYIAADRVGYESSSQFSREFKRYFGQSPADMIREQRT
ncbi:Transcriptional regulator, AraC family [hydrothermal vent metagenome]|uniref:Transcriptional regulator, AraC family n=1 Tax=hydrothermal vent metagenome TaxID=652676 RepID=A0A3B0YNV2_9ZZZZ